MEWHDLSRSSPSVSRFSGSPRCCCCRCCLIYLSRGNYAKPLLHFKLLSSSAPSSSLTSSSHEKGGRERLFPLVPPVFFPRLANRELVSGEGKQRMYWPGITLLSSHSSFMPHLLSFLPTLLSHCYLCLRRLEQEFLSSPSRRGDLPRACIRSRDRVSTKRRMSEAARMKKKKKH